MADKTATQIHSEHPAAGYPDDAYFAFDNPGSGFTEGIAGADLRIGTLRDSDLAATSTILALTSGQAVLTSQVAAVQTQSSLVAARGLGTEIVGATTVISDLWGADAAVPFVGDDRTPYLATVRVANENSTAGVRSSTVTTNGTTSVTRTAGTAWVAADSGSILAHPNIPANAEFTFLTSTTGTISVAATGSSSAAATLTSPNMGLNFLTKIAGTNSINPSTFFLAPCGIGNIYEIDVVWLLTAGVDTNNHTEQLRIHVYPTVSGGGNTDFGWGTATDGATPAIVLSGGFGRISTATPIGITRPSFEMRISASAVNQRFRYRYFTRELGFVKDH